MLNVINIHIPIKIRTCRLKRDCIVITTRGLFDGTKPFSLGKFAWRISIRVRYVAKIFIAGKWASARIFRHTWEYFPICGVIYYLWGGVLYTSRRIVLIDSSSWNSGLCVEKRFEFIHYHLCYLWFWIIYRHKSKAHFTFRKLFPWYRCVCNFWIIDHFCNSSYFWFKWRYALYYHSTTMEVGIFLCMIQRMWFPNCLIVFSRCILWSFDILVISNLIHNLSLEFSNQCKSMHSIKLN